MRSARLGDPAPVIEASRKAILAFDPAIPRSNTPKTMEALLDDKPAPGAHHRAALHGSAALALLLASRSGCTACFPTGSHAHQ
jgi:hypothetical protein